MKFTTLPFTRKEALNAIKPENFQNFLDEISLLNLNRELSSRSPHDYLAEAYLAATECGSIPTMQLLEAFGSSLQGVTMPDNVVTPFLQQLAKEDNHCIFSQVAMSFYSLFCYGIAAEHNRLQVMEYLESFIPDTQHFAPDAYALAASRGHVAILEHLHKTHQVFTLESMYDSKTCRYDYEPVAQYWHCPLPPLYSAVMGALLANQLPAVQYTFAMLPEEKRRECIGQLYPFKQSVLDKLELGGIATEAVKSWINNPAKALIEAKHHALLMKDGYSFTETVQLVTNLPHLSALARISKNPMWDLVENTPLPKEIWHRVMHQIIGSNIPDKSVYDALEILHPSKQEEQEQSKDTKKNISYSR